MAQFLLEWDLPSTGRRLWRDRGGWPGGLLGLSISPLRMAPSPQPDRQHTGLRHLEDLQKYEVSPGE